MAAMAAFISRSRRAKPMRSAGSASISRTNSWCISTIPRTSICSPRKSGLSAMAACGCRIRIMYGHSEIDIKFPTPIPVNITYQTAFVDEAGKLQIRKDLYNRDAAMLALLRNSKSKDLENVVARAQPSSDRPPGVNFASDNTYYGYGQSYSGPSFFERLFGAPVPPAPIPGRRLQQRRI